MKTTTIDIGNTRTKIGSFLDQNLQKVDIVQDIPTYIKSIKTNAIIISSTKHLSDELLKDIKNNATPFIVLDHLTPLPIQNLYRTPKTLGMDRLAGVMGAYAIYPNTPCLLIDAGTCITYDFIDDKGSYHGGSIAPGLRMRLKAMHHYTDKLPLIEPNTDTHDILGKSTEEAMLSGAINGAKAEIAYYKAKFLSEYPKLQTILIGGDSLYFDKSSKKINFVHQNIVHIGLNRILTYLCQKKLNFL